MQKDVILYVFLYSSHQPVCLQTKPVAFPLTDVSWLFHLVKQKLSSKVVKLEEFKKKNQTCSEVNSKDWGLFIADKGYPIENNFRNGRVVSHFS